MLPVYLDYAATTPVDPRVAEKMLACLTIDGNFANAASTAHIYGWKAAEAVEEARQQVADLLQVDVREIVFTSGATESDNLAIKGVAQAYAAKGRHIITSCIEHKAVLDSCAQLEREGFDVTYLKPDAAGLIHPAQVQAALREDTILVSLMHVNNETGVITDVAAVGDICRAAGVVFHVDAAQSAGKIALDCKSMKIDLLSLSAHKMYGPKGIGALYVSRSPKVELQAQVHGGGHERGMRSGTLATHQIVALGEAAAIAQQDVKLDNARLVRLRDKLWAGIADLPGLQRNGSVSHVAAGFLNVSFSGVEGEVLLMSLRKLAISSGSACNSASMKPSYVLTAMGVSASDADSAVRFSLGRFSSDEDIDIAIAHIREIYGRLQAAS